MSNVKEAFVDESSFSGFAQYADEQGKMWRVGDQGDSLYSFFEMTEDGSAYMLVSCVRLRDESLKTSEELRKLHYAFLKAIEII